MDPVAGAGGELRAVPGRWWRASLFVSTFAAAAVQLAEGVATAVGEREQLGSVVSIDARLLEQLDPQRDIPRWASTRLVDVELPAQQHKSCWTSAHLEQQLMEAQERAIASLRGAWTFAVSSHAAGRLPPNRATRTIDQGPNSDLQGAVSESGGIERAGVASALT
jgi:hypothetical protein